MRSENKSFIKVGSKESFNVKYKKSNLEINTKEMVYQNIKRNMNNKSINRVW